MVCPNKNTKEWKALVSRYGESESYTEYIKSGFDVPDITNRLNEVWSQMKKIELQDAYDKLRDSSYSNVSSIGRDIEDVEFNNSRISQLSKQIARNIKSITNVNIRVIDDNDINKLILNDGSNTLDSNKEGMSTFGLWNSDEKIALLNIKYANGGVLIHEAFMHPFLEVIKTERPLLYKKLLERSKDIDGIDSHIKENYDSDTYIDGEEHIATAMTWFSNERLLELSKDDINKWDRFKRAADEFIRYINIKLRDFFGLNSIKNLNDNLTFGKLFDIIRLSNEKYDIASKIENKNFKESREISENRTSDPDKIKEIFKREKDKIEFLVDSHKYINKYTGQVYKSVSEIKQENGYGDDVTEENTSESFREYYKLTSNVGTTIHAYLDSIATKEKYEKGDNVPMTGKAKKQLREIYNRLLDEFEFIATEQVVTDDKTGIAGTMDGFLRHKKDGYLLQIDNKTKIVDRLDTQGNSIRPGGRRGKQFGYYNSSKFGKSDKLKHDFQQSMYKRMSELLGIDTKYKGIIPIEVVIKERKNGDQEIHEINLTSLLPLTSNSYYNLTSNNNITPLIDSILDIKKSDNIDKSLDLNIERLENIAKKGLDILKKRAAYLSIIGEQYSSDLLNKDISNISQLTVESSLYSIISTSLGLMKPHMIKYNQLLDLEKTEGSGVWNFNQLSSWRNFSLAFDGVLDEIRSYYFDNPDMFKDIDGFNKDEFDKLFEETVNIKNTLKLAYKNKGMPQWLDWMSRHSSIIEDKHRQNFQKSYKSNLKKNKLELDKDAMDSATIEYIKANKTAIDLETKQFIKAQSEIAQNDTNTLYRWADNVFDTKDPIVGVMSKIYYNKMLEMREASNNWYIDLSNIVAEFDKKYNTGSFDDQQKLYDFMLDYDDDGYAYILQRIPISFTEAYQSFVNKTKKENKDDPKIIGLLISEWLDKNAPFSENYEESYVSDKLILYSDLLDEGRITEDEYNVLIQNEHGEDYKMSTEALYSNGDISGETSYILNKELRDLRWSYREPDIEKYPNKKWESLSKLENSDPKKKLYEFIKDTSETGQQAIPKRFKRGYRLPGVRKEFVERIIDGQSTARLIKEKAKESFTVVSDDITRGQQEIANEIDNGLEFVPIYYTTSLTKEDQSFDIPNIYKLWYGSVLNYEFTSHILPELEFTRFVVNERQVVKRNRGKSVINKLASVYNQSNVNSENVESFVNSNTNNVADQLNQWFSQWVYGKSDRNLGESFGIDHAKILRMLGHFSSLKIMSVNLLAMVNNATMAETAQLIEAHSGKLMNKKTYAKATWTYIKDLPNILSDVGNRVFKSKTNLALEYFNIFFDMQDSDMRDKSKFRRLFRESALFATNNLGEHEAQSRFLIGALMSTEVFDREGVSIGNLWDNLEISDSGKMKISQNVAENAIDLKSRISRKVTQTLRDMHGNYSDYSATAMSSHGVLSLLQQFRKWIVPGIRRRFDSQYYSEFSEMNKLGYFRGGANYYKNVAVSNYHKIASFFGKVINEGKVLDVSVAADFSMLSDVEKEAVRRLNMDIRVLSIMSVMIMLLSYYRDDDDFKEMNPIQKAFFNNLAYQLYRARTEQTFYINPNDFLTIVQSPMASMSVASSWVSVLEQLIMNPFEQYTTGKKKGDYKLGWKLYNQIPVIRQLYRVTNAEESLNALMQPSR